MQRDSAEVTTASRSATVPLHPRAGVRSWRASRWRDESARHACACMRPRALMRLEARSPTACGRRLDSQAPPCPRVSVEILWSYTEAPKNASVTTERGLDSVSRATGWGAVERSTAAKFPMCMPCHTKLSIPKPPPTSSPGRRLGWHGIGIGLRRTM